MFTGIVQSIGVVDAIEASSLGGPDRRIRVTAEPERLAAIDVGDSVAVNGVCLTASELCSGGFIADVSAETLGCTNLGELVAGGRVNLETAVTPTTALGGHLVSGHVDGVGEILRRAPDGNSVRLEVRAPRALARYIAPKGSITLDGVSLTVNQVNDAEFEVNLVPHTLEATIMDGYQPGVRVNIEVDVVARYLERLLQYSRDHG